MSLLKKITARTVFGSKSDVLELVLADKTAKHYLYRVTGIATSTKEGDGDNGPWQALRGRFKVVNYHTGEEHTSGICFLPNYITDMIAGELQASQDAKPQVAFVVDIWAKYSEASATTYEYGADQVIEADKDNDPLELLDKQANTIKPLSLPNNSAKKEVEDKSKKAAE